MGKIENIKTYDGQVLDNIFFRPMLTGKSAEELGIKVMYNVPVPTTLHFWKRKGDVLQKYTSGGWSGGAPADKYQKEVRLNKVKAEMAYSADDYFSTVYELITGRPDVNLDDLSGTELEEAETSLFRESIAESVRATMWYGDVNRNELGTFDGFVKRILSDAGKDKDIVQMTYMAESGSCEWAEALLKKMWEESTEELHALRSEGNLAFFVSSDIYNAYEESLDGVAIEAAYLAKQMGREGLYFRGIPVVDVQMNGYKGMCDNLPHSFAILTDRRNLALAVNTSDYPGTEVRMWYNPDQMENRQRAIFMAGCDYLLPELVTFAVAAPFKNFENNYQNGELTILAEIDESATWFRECELSVRDITGKLEVDAEPLDGDGGSIEASFGVNGVKESWLEFYSVDGWVIKHKL